MAGIMHVRTNAAINSVSVPEFASELQAQSELDLALAVRRIGDSSGGAAVLQVRGVEHDNPRDRIVKVRVIEDVKGLCAKLEIDSFP